MTDMRPINPNLFLKIRAALVRQYIIHGGPVPPAYVETDPSLANWNPRTIERTMRVMAERGMIIRPRKGFYIPNGSMKIERVKTLEEFA